MSEPNSISNKLRVRSSSVTTIVSLSLVLFLLGLVGLILINTKKIADHFKETIGFQLIMNDGAKEGDITKLQRLLDASPFVKSSKFISKEEAAKMLQQDLGEDFISFIGYNPLKPSIDIRLNADYAVPDSLIGIEHMILENKIVKEVVYPKALLSTMNANMHKAALVLLAFSVLMLLIAIALINNTIRLAIYSKRFIIKTMQLVGATRAFIGLPFVLKGVRQGIYSSLVAILLLLLIMYITQRQFPDLLVVQDSATLLKVFGLVVLLGITIGAISTALAVRKYLRLRTNQLHMA